MSTTGPRRRGPTTLRGALLQGVTVSLAWGLGLGAGGLVATSQTGGPPWTTTDASQRAGAPTPEQDRQRTEAEAAAAHLRTLLAGTAGKDCWTGQAPADNPIPTYAVVTREGAARAAYVPAQVGFEIWLDGKPGTLHGFCR